MNREQAMARVSGCYIAIPTQFHDNLELNLPGIRRHVRFLLDGGVRTGNAVLLAAGGAGEFPTLSFEERLQVAEAILAEAGDKVGVLLGAQTPNQREAVALARAAKKMGAAGIQVSPPFYHPHTDGDVHDYLRAIADAAEISLVLYTTYWQGYKVSMELLSKLVDEIPHLVAVKWAAPSAYEYEQGMKLFAKRLCMIDNQLQFVLTHMMGGRGVNTHPSNYWPEWSVKFWNLLEAGKYREAQEESVKVVTPYYELCSDIAKFTGGEGHLDKLCLELIGLDSSRCRPPIRDIRPLFREKARQMLQSCGVPRVSGR